jgi:hypothetical protein
MPKRFALKHGDIEVDYDTAALPGCAVLSYKDGNAVKSFTSNEITTTQTPLGPLVSVALSRILDGGACFGESFGFFVPDLDAPSWKTEKISTAGIYLERSDPNAHPEVLESYRCIELEGTAAETVIVPLEEASAP